MKDRDFRTRLAGTAKAALVVAGLLGLASVAASSLRAQDAGTAAGVNPPSGQVVTAYLDYREVNYSFVNWNLAVNARSAAFKQEPALAGGKISRGTLRLGGGTTNELAFAWDRAAGKLYLDLNRNLDLTDDPAGVFSRASHSVDSYQTFTNIHLPFRTQVGERQALVDLSFNAYSGLYCTAAMRSFWQGKVILQGEEYQLGLLASSFEPGQSLESGNLLLRPWAERNSSFSIYGGSLEALPFSRNLFVGNHAYQLQGTNVAPGDTAKVRVQFTEQQPALGELKIAGEFIRRVTLGGGPYMVVLDKPEPVVKVPVGSYGPISVWLKKGGVEATLDARAEASVARITVNDKRPEVLTVGGPLTNSVSISRRGKNLALNYQLVGAGGAYQLANQDRSHPPEFAVYHGDKKVASGKFEFG